MSDEQLLVTQPFMPPLDEFIPYLESIWQSKVVTNNGPMHQRLETELGEFLNAPHLSLLANGTLALVVALQALRISGEVITTPYSFVATSNALVWNKLNPVFVDVDRSTCNIDVDRIEQAITPKTSAILAVHCYGNPCDVNAIQEIADNYGLRVIYDAAHAFGVTLNGQSILSFGDLSVMSTHATKVFHTFEGGLIAAKDAQVKQRIDFLKNFGFADEVTVMAPGINAKMSEINAAFGLLQLQYVQACIDRRLRIAAKYREALSEVGCIRLLEDQEGVRANGSYFPIFLRDVSVERRDEIYSRLREAGIYGRRYFFPLISEFPTYRGLESSRKVNLPTAIELSSSVICLPVYPAMSDESIERVVIALKRALSE
jgi:dTDP-4-amino-4,6-dideoxygalactose transaminase